MIDSTKVLRAYLLATTLGPMVGTRIWGELNTPPPEYLPSQGAAITFKSRGGPIDYTSAILTTSWHFRIFGEDEYAARDVYLELVGVLHDHRGDGLLSALLEVQGQTLTDPDTRWPYILTFFQTQMYSGLTAMIPQ